MHTSAFILLLAQSFFFSVNSGLVDLLQPLRMMSLGNPKVSTTLLKNGHLAYEVEGTAAITTNADDYFKDTWIKDFIFLVYVKMKSKKSTLFSVSDINGVIQLSVVLEQVTNSMTKVEIYYTPSSKTTSNLLTKLHMPGVMITWTMISIKAIGNWVYLYKNCVLVDSEEVGVRQALQVQVDSLMKIGGTGNFSLQDFKVILFCF